MIVGTTGNLVDLAFPLLTTIGSVAGGFFAFEGNTALASLLAPKLKAIPQFFYLQNSHRLAMLDLSSLEEVRGERRSGPKPMLSTTDLVRGCARRFTCFGRRA